MSTTIKIKNSSIAGKIPAAGDLVTAELAINLVDQKLYSKDVNGAVFEVGGASVGQGPTPPPNGNEIGDLWWDGDFLLVWNGSDWEVVGGVTSVNGETGDVILNLGDLNDVNLALGVSNGDIIAWNGSAWVNTAAPPADISGSSINDLNDVDTVGADDGDILVWNESAGEWQATNRGTVPENTSDLNNDGENGTDPFITEADVNSILAGNNIDGTPNPGANEYLQSGDNVSELVNDAGYITDAGVTKIIAGDSIEITPVEGTGEVTIDVAIDASGVVINLDDLDDVNVPSPNSGDVLAYDGAEWVSAAAPPADISGSSINQLNDVDAAGANNGDMLIWDGTNWVNVPAPTKTSDLTNDGENGADPFITEGEVTNILNGLNPDGTPNPGSEGYLKPGDNVSELNNDAGYITNADTAADSDKLCGEDCDYYLNYQNFINTPDPGEENLWEESGTNLYPKDLTQSVGIGTDSPTAPLTINKAVFGDHTTEDFYRIKLQDQGGTANDVGFGIPENNVMGYNASQGHRWTLGNNNEAARIDSTGNVGIGTDAPAEKLDVNGTILSTAGIYNADTDEAYLIASTPGYQSGPGWQAAGFQHRLKVNSGGAPRVTIDTPQGGEAFCVVNNGNVGIGTDDPQTPLHVNGDNLGTAQDDSIAIAQFEGNTSASGNQSKLIISNERIVDGVNWQTSSLRLQREVDATPMQYIDFTATRGSTTGVYDIAFGVENGGDRMRITQEGNVGIGTADPRQKLHVDGTVRATVFDLEALPALP